MYTVMYGWRLASVPLEPVVLFETEIPVVALLVKWAALTHKLPWPVVRVLTPSVLVTL